MANSLSLAGPRSGARAGARVPAVIALAVAGALSLALVVWAFTYPAYEGVETRGDVTVESTRTLVEENGLGVLIPVLVPLAVTALVAWLILRAREPLGRILAWVLVALLGAFAVVAMFSIGMYVLPIAVVLAIAVAWPRSTTA